MKIILILVMGLMLQNCSGNSKKVIKSPDDLQSFVNIFCEKPSYKSTEKVIKVCSNGFSKDLNIATQKSLMSGKLKLADIVSHSLVSSEVITHSENKSIVKTYNLEATSTLNEVSISNYRVVHTKVILEKGGYRVMHLLSLKIS
tara:strand:+ start:83 stop:514 length:432 start_codon:yes stop_codon:yes gene_type:complete